MGHKVAEPDVPWRRQALLDAATTATEIMGLECFEAPVLRGFQAYGLPSAIRPTLAWNPVQARSLARLDATNSTTTNKFALREVGVRI